MGTPTGVRWYEIRNPNGSPNIYQQGTYQPDSSYRWMGSLAVDQAGNMALGFSLSSAGMFPAIATTGRLASDPLGTLTQSETTLIQGTGSQNGNQNRWGDCSAMTIDPSDDCTFWYTNVYYSSTGKLADANWFVPVHEFTQWASAAARTPRLLLSDDRHVRDSSL